MRVLWLSYPTDTAYQLPGRLLAARSSTAGTTPSSPRAATRHPSLQILDWNTYSANSPAGSPVTASTSPRRGGGPRPIHQGGPRPAADRAVPGDVGTRRRVPRRVGQPAATADRQVRLHAARAEAGARHPRRRDGWRPRQARRRPHHHRSTSTLRCPNNTRAAVLSVTAVDACRDGYLTVYPCGPRPGDLEHQLRGRSHDRRHGDHRHHRSQGVRVRLHRDGRRHRRDRRVRRAMVSRSTR